MKVFVAALLLAVGVFAGEECIDDDPHCKKFDAEELVMYCNDPSTGVGKGCCESCKGYMRPASLRKRGEEVECVDNYEVCGEYLADDLTKYCNDPETGVAEECCKSCEDYIGKGKTLSKREITFPEICEDEKSENGEVCKLYSPRDLDNYCHDESDGVLDLCCATCKAHLQAATLLKRSEKAECVDNMEICKTYGKASLADYCNDPSTGVADECCASCQGHMKVAAFAKCCHWQCTGGSCMCTSECKNGEEGVTYPRCSGGSCMLSEAAFAKERCCHWQCTGGSCMCTSACKDGEEGVTYPRCSGGSCMLSEAAPAKQKQCCDWSCDMGGCWCVTACDDCDKGTGCDGEASAAAKTQATTYAECSGGSCMLSKEAAATHGKKKECCSWSCGMGGCWCVVACEDCENRTGCGSSFLSKKASSDSQQCVDNMEICKTYGAKSLAMYCNDPSTGVAEECCASCQGYIKPTLLKLDPCSGPCTREYTPICGTDGRTYNNHCLFKQGQCRNPALEIAYYGVCKDKRGVEETCVDKPRFAAVCKIYDEEELGLYCNDPETGVLDNCCASCQGHLHEVEEEEEEPELLKRGIEWPEVCQDSDDEYGAHCKLYSPKDLGKYCPDPTTGMMEVCCGTCKAALKDF